MGVKLGSGIAVHWPGAVMLEFGGNHLARGFSRVIASDAGLDVMLQFVQGNPHALAVGLPDPLVPTDEGGNRNALGRTEGGVPAGAVAGGGDRFSLAVLILIGDAMPDQLVAGLGMLPLGQAIELIGANLALQAPALASSPCHSPRTPPAWE